MILGTFLGIFFIPLFFVVVQGFAMRRKRPAPPEAAAGGSSHG
jgi:hypothetical protein